MLTNHFFRTQEKYIYIYSLAQRTCQSLMLTQIYKNKFKRQIRCHTLQLAPSHQTRQPVI